MPRLTDWKYELYNEDCFDTFQRLPSEFVDLVLVDPPYGTTQCKWDSVIRLEPMWKELLRISKRHTPLVFFSSQPFTSVLVSSRIKDFKYRWIWDRTKSPTGHLNAKIQPMRRTEDISVFCKGVPSYFPIMTDGHAPVGHKGGKPRKSGVMGANEVVESDGVTSRFPIDLLPFEKVQTRTNRFHPTQKPVALMEYMVKTYSNEGDIVLDFAMGSGTTGVACGNLGRRFIGCDNDTEHGYFQIASQRIKEAYSVRQIGSR